jgi:vacuolar protein-sorting-associated protein 4
VVCRRIRNAKGEEEYEACSPGDAGAEETTLVSLAERGLASKVATPMITMRDFEKALIRARPTVSEKDLQTHEQFTTEFGEEG